MFHVVLVLLSFLLPFLLTFLILLPFEVGIGLEVFISVFFQKRLWLRCVPYGLGVAGLALSVSFLREYATLRFFLTYWGIYFGCVLLTGLIVRAVKAYITKRNRGD